MNIKNTQKGFTLIETIVAIFILSLTVAALISLAAGGFYSVRYSRNQIVADALMQESIEYVRNTRDTFFQQGQTWDGWLASLNVDTQGNPLASINPSRGCFASDGCYIDPYDATARVRACNGQCPTVRYYPTQGFYGYSGGSYPFTGNPESYATSYVRTMNAVIDVNDPNQVTLTSTVRWLNGTSPKVSTQSVVLTNWRP